MGQGLSGKSASDAEKGRIERAGPFDVGLPVTAAASLSPSQTAKESRQ